VGLLRPATAGRAKGTSVLPAPKVDNLVSADLQQTSEQSASLDLPNLGVPAPLE